MSVETRQVVTPSGARIRGYFASLKNGSLIEWESFLERDFLRVVEFLNWVSRFRAYQQRIVVRTDGGSFCAFPDFALIADAPEERIIEVKCNRDLKRREVVDRLDAIKEHYQQQGITYEVWSETEIRKQPRLANVCRLLPERRPGHCNALRTHKVFRELCKRERDITLKEIADRASDTQMPMRFLANGLVDFDLNQPLSPHTTVRLH